MSQRLISEENEERMREYIKVSLKKLPKWERGHPKGMSFNDCLDMLLETAGF